MDYFLRPKPAYYAIARELRAYTVGAARTEHKTHPSDTSAAQLALETRVALWGANATLEPRRATLAVAAFDLGDPRWTAAFEVRDVVLALVGLALVGLALVERVLALVECDRLG